MLNDIITEVFKSKMILVGSSTINNGILTAAAGIKELWNPDEDALKRCRAFGESLEI